MGKDKEPEGVLKQPSPDPGVKDMFYIKTPLMGM